MVFSAKKIELIERYYNENLTPEELEFFNEQLVKGADFAEEVKQFDFVFKGIDAVRAQELKQQFIAYEQKYLAKNNKSRFMQFARNQFSVAAVCSVFLLIGSTLFLFSNTDSNSEVLYSQYFEPYPNVIAPTTRALNHEVSSIYLAMNEYDAMNYSKAIVAFDVLLAHSGLKNEILFYKAVSLMSNGDHKAAKTQLELMYAHGEFKNQRKWYLALASLQLEEFKETEVLLNEIVGDKSSYAVYAEELLEEFFSN